jgi:hypothetical protein
MIPLVLTSLAVALALSQTPTPAKPDFSGTWQIDRTRSESAGAVKLTIRQTAAAVSIETTRGDKTWEVTYPIALSRPPEAAGITTSSPVAYWDGTKLVTEGLTDVQGQTVSTKATRSLNAAGSEMTVESVVVIQHGYSIRGSQNYATAKDVFTRVRHP